MREMVIGVFRHGSSALRAMETLRELGFFDNQLTLLTPPDSLLSRSDEALARSGRHLDELGLPLPDIAYYLRELTSGHSLVVIEAHGRSLHALTALDCVGPFERALFRLADEWHGRVPAAVPIAVPTPVAAVAR